MSAPDNAGHPHERRTRSPHWFSRIFASDPARHEGVRPFHIGVLRTLYVLMFVGVGVPVWGEILNHQGPWDHMHAVAFCVWAAYPTLGLLGLRQPLRMLPLVLFMLLYKSIWLLAFAYPLWAAGQLAGPPLEMARVFRWVLPIALLMPWGYVWRSYVLGTRATRA